MGHPSPWEGNLSLTSLATSSWSWHSWGSAVMSLQTEFSPHHLLPGHWTYSAVADLQGRRNLPHVARSHKTPTFPSMVTFHLPLHQGQALAVPLSSFQAFASAGSLWTSCQSHERFFVIFPDAVHSVDLLPQVLQICHQCTPPAGKELISPDCSPSERPRLISAAPDLESCLFPPQLCLKQGFCCTWNSCSGECQKLCPAPRHHRGWALAHCRHQGFQPPPMHPCSKACTALLLLALITSWMNAWHSLIRCQLKARGQSTFFFSGVAERGHSKPLEFLRSKNLC